MLSMAGKGCIMGSAHQRLKDLHPELEVIGTNADDAVPHYLRNLFIVIVLYLVSCQPNTPRYNGYSLIKEFSIVALLIITTILWAFSFSFYGEYLAGHVDSYFAVLVRVGLAALVFLPFCVTVAIA